MPRGLIWTANNSGKFFDISVASQQERPYSFSIANPSRLWFLCGESMAETLQWIHAMEKSRSLHSYKN